MQLNRSSIPPPIQAFRRRQPRRAGLRWVVAAFALVALLVWLVLQRPDAPEPPAATQDTDVPASGPPWRYGRADARFTLTLYADLECPYCKVYYPALLDWIDGHPDANLQWHHLPLAMHEPAATQLARLAECAGETGGNMAFFEATAWLYQHTRGEGQGLPADLHYPGLTPAMQGCLDSERPQTTIRAQANEGSHSGIAATPTVRVQDHRSGKSLLLPGPVEGDALLSALDLIASPEAEATEAPDITPPQVAPNGDTPR